MILGKHIAMNYPNGHFLTNLLILKDKNDDNRYKENKVVFFQQDLWDLMKNGVTSIGENVTNEQKDAHKDLRKKRL